MQYRTRRRGEPQSIGDVFGRSAWVIQETDFVLLAIHRPEIGGLHLARAGSSCLDRRFVHRDDAGEANRAQLCRMNGFEQRDGAGHQFGEPATADVDAGILQFGVLAIQRLMIRKFVDDYAGDEADVGAAAVEDANWLSRARRTWVSQRLMTGRTYLKMT